MIHHVFSQYAVLIPIALVAFVGLHTLFRCTSEKKNYFLLCIASILVELLGHMLELVSTNSDEAFTAIRVFYLGMAFLAPSVLFFIADYCDLRIKRVIKVLLLFPTIIFIIGSWTTNTTGLLYSSFYYDIYNTRYVIYEPGSLMLLFRCYPALYAIGALAILLHRFTATGGKRRIYVILLLSIALPLISEVAYGITVALNHYAPTFYFTPYTLSLMSVLLYLGIGRYEMFDSSPISSIEALNTISEAVILLDDNLTYVSANNAARALFPWLSRIVPGTAVHDFAHWPRELTREVFTGSRFTLDFKLADSGFRHYRAKAHLFTSNISRKKHWSVLIQDVTEAEEFMKQLEEAAYTDTLTGLYNRRHFSEIAAPFVERAKRMELPYYVMIADLDFFKTVNDTYGHLAGDAVLRNIATIMKAAVRSYDILARWGGEEFIFLITDSEAHSVVALAERIRHSVEVSECLYQDIPLRITISFGIAQSMEGDDLTSLILRADEALYTSKQSGRNCVTMWGMTNDGTP